jgi:excisionase family DNA binding protein
MSVQQSSQIYYTKREAVEYTRHAPRTLDYAVANGELRAFKPSRKRIFLKDDLDAWIQRRLASADLDAIVSEVVAEMRNE